MTCSAWSMSVSRRELDVQQRARPVLALVADADDRAVGHVPDRPVGGAQPRRAQRHRLDRPARRAVEVDDVADAELVLGEDEHARQEVLDERLRAEARARRRRRRRRPAAARRRRRPRSSTMKHANSKITKPATLRRMLVSAMMRCSARRLVASTLEHRARRAPAHRAQPLAHDRRSSRCAARVDRRAPTSLLTISAPIAIRTIVSGVPTTMSAASASVRFSVRSRISRQTALGIRPHVSRSSDAVIVCERRRARPRR